MLSNHSGTYGASAARLAVDDAYGAYDQFTDATHALCDQHIVPELTGIGEFDQAAWADGWPEDVITLLGDAHRWIAAWRRHGHHRLPEFTAEDPSWRYDELVARALRVHPARRGKQTPARSAVLRLQIRKTEVSSGFRTLAGAQTFLALRGYISTVRMNGLRVFDTLRDALRSNPWMPPAPTTT